MASEVSAPKNTGGGGFVFENDVCAWLLACMLGGEPAFEPSLGTIERIDFQARPDGWLLDDAVVTTKAVGLGPHRIAMSIKSNPQFTASAVPQEFVTMAWEQWLHAQSEVFDRGSDLMWRPLPHRGRGLRAPRRHRRLHQHQHHAVRAAGSS